MADHTAGIQAVNLIHSLLVQALTEEKDEAEKLKAVATTWLDEHKDNLKAQRWLSNVEMQVQDALAEISAELLTDATQETFEGIASDAIGAAQEILDKAKEDANKPVLIEDNHFEDIQTAITNKVTALKKSFKAKNALEAVFADNFWDEVKAQLGDAAEQKLADPKALLENIVTQSKQLHSDIEDGKATGELEALYHQIAGPDGKSGLIGDFYTDLDLLGLRGNKNSPIYDVKRKVAALRYHTHQSIPGKHQE